ncbi:sugar kinase [Roseimicrobium sp. ORNL1]|nr:sugar kinase [Roseimicrobium sp. ORNL1]
MMRLATPGHARFQQAMPGMLQSTFAGAEATVAAALAHWGGNASFVSALPAHAIADACLVNLRQFGVDTRPVLRTPHGRLGLFFLEAGANQRPHQVIYDREGASVAITPPEAYDWNAIFADATWFHITGITPALSENAANVARTALREASARGLQISLDVNFRSKLWNWSLPLTPVQLAARTLQELMPMVTVFMGGREDAAALLDIQADAGAKNPDVNVARKLATRYPQLTHIAMSLREGVSANHSLWSGMLHAVATDTTHFAPMHDGDVVPHEIPNIVDRLGAGDAFAAGIIYALSAPGSRDPAHAVRFAVAAGCLAHSVEGDFVHVSRAEVEALMQGDASSRVKR